MRPPGQTRAVFLMYGGAITQLLLGTGIPNFPVGRVEGMM